MLMKSNAAADLPIVDVPLELRGLSDEDIIRNSESGGERSYRARPSKKERILRKLNAEAAKMRKIASEYGENRTNRPVSMAASLPMPKIRDFVQGAGKPASYAEKPVPAAKRPVPAVPAANTASQKPAVPPRPASGRVLKSSFCGKMGFTFKAQAVPEKKSEPAPAAKRGRGRPRKNPLQ